MCPKDLFLVVCCFGLLGGLRLTSTTTTTTFVAAMSMANQDLERYFRSTNATQTLATMTMTEDRIAMDFYTYAFLNFTVISKEPNEVIKFNEEKARYGEGKILSVKGKLVHIADAIVNADDTACSPDILGTNGQPIPPMGELWIALVKRGHCTFEEKVKNVHAKGATGVIIYNDKQVINLEKMQIKGKSRNITAVITYQDIGLVMAEKLDSGEEIIATITEGKSGMRPINSLNRTSVLFVSISFIVLMIISLVWLIFYYIQRFRYLQTKDQQSRHLCSVTKKAIMKIPTKTGKSTDEKDAESDCCAICIETYKPSDCIRVLPCKHEFHKNCIDPWLIEHRTCPMCKLDVLKFYGYVVGDQIHSSPNPQHLPPNDATLDDDNDVPVVIVAVAPLPSSTTTHASAAEHYQHNNHTQTHQQHQNQNQNQHHQQQQQQQQQLQPNLNISNSSSNSDISNSNCNNACINSNNININSNSNSNSNGNRNVNCNCNTISNVNANNNRLHTFNVTRCHQNHQHQHIMNANNRCCCNNQNTITIQNCSSNNINNDCHLNTSDSNRRNSAPQVLEVSTASRKVTDV